MGIECTILGATGAVGQRFVQLLENHPWFEPVRFCASPASAGMLYGEQVERSGGRVPERFAGHTLCAPDPTADPTPLVFSALDADVAIEVEEDFARAGSLVVSNASAHRMDPLVPLMVPEVNADHIELLTRQRDERGYPGVGGLLTNPNCSTIGLTLALAALRVHGLQRLHVVTMQALSGAGLKGPSAQQMLDNILPFIPGEEEKLGAETCKIFGELIDGSQIRPMDVAVSAQCNRVGVIDGHTGCVSLELQSKVSREELIEGWQAFRSVPQKLDLPSAPKQPTIYHTALDAPQPRLHRGLGRGMSTSIGRLQTCAVLDWRFVFLSHNTLRGAAGGAVLVAELAKARGLLG
ncbi:MAG: aspartate-semialdehyde dehydrogenase [Planctomycetota bacterium]|jgi:aspartate-semialdehyde dehydrogenase